MEIRELQSLYSKLPQIAAVDHAIADKSVRALFLEGLIASSAPMVFSGLAKRSAYNMLFVLQDADEAGYFYHDLSQIIGDGVLFFPSSYRRAVKYGQRDAASEILRTEVLARLNSQSPSRQESLTSGRLEGASSLYIVTYPEAIAELVVSQKNLDEKTISLQVGQTVDVDQLLLQLRQLGFREVDYVYEPGQFALRGSILDVFSYSGEYPYRIDFFGDDIDSIRTFEVENQLSRDKRDGVDIVPELADGGDKVPLLSFLPEETIIVVKDMAFVRDSIDRTYQEGFSVQAIAERTEGATEMEQRDILKKMRSEVQLITGQQFMRDALEYKRIEFGHRPLALPDTTITFNITPQPLFHKNFELLQKSLEDYLLQGYSLYILADSRKQNERLKEIFESIEQVDKLTSRRVDKLCDTINSSTRQHVNSSTKISFTPVDKTIHEGFADNDLRVCFFTDHQIFDRFHKYNLRSDKARSGKVALTLKEISQFEVGDYVVHLDHGIGRFGGLLRMPQGDGYQEMIKITYQRGDSIYVSIHSLHKVAKYKAQDNGEPPRLSTLGTGQWENLKERTKKKIKDIARDLILLYAKRRNEQGFAYSADSFMQHELEASFLYEDTPDQLKATNDVKADMENQRPMDRLVCGDVGFGKTEVAVRAAFKAACDSKQVAVLVPTTVLAYQHYQTFRGRLKDFPVRVDYLSRARSAKQTKEVLKDLEEGKIDILIGTHKLIGKSVKFKDLGLLIIDEEQKFGVSTKEKLRQMKSNVDTLTMSATPIPRTLQFSLVGARDLSVIQTPPPNRYPIQTEIHTFNAEIIADAINFEMSRNGQVYFVNNRIKDLSRIAEMINKYIPDARIAIGHGQMKPEELERIIMDFSNHDFDVLLSTTIVENGIDIPNANTIIINGAHNFGLSDLHQMRGRVGRGNRKAFCYLLAPPLAALNPESRRRLEALENFSDLGSGINIAMQDLDIRGAGNLLGSEQSGFIADLGYETYLKILNEAVVELRNEQTSPNLSEGEEPAVHKQKLITPPSEGQGGGSYYVSDCTIDSDIEMHFPANYVPSDSERMLLYRELDGLKSDDEVARYRSRLLDRFGKIPQVAEELMRVVALRRIGKRLGCEKLILKQGRMAMYFVGNENSPYYQSDVFGVLLDFISRHPRRFNFRQQKGRNSVVVSDVKTVEEAIKVLKNIIGEQ
ncbi:MAG: transcription-repair coupling factor [Prevotella sp.]|nr:transcription-repair coupling factor [Prevotella sp.]